MPTDTTDPTYVAVVQTRRGVTTREIGTLKVARVLAHEPDGKPVEGVLALYAVHKEWADAGESIFRAKGGWAPLVWEYNGVGVVHA